MVATVGGVAFMSAGAGRHGIRHISAWRMAAAVLGSSRPGVSIRTTSKRCRPPVMALGSSAAVIAANFGLVASRV